MEERLIRISGARQHNLKNLNLEIPRDKLIVITGPSGSGKSSLAFDTIYAEGQRRYVESLSTYARQFLEQLDKPDMDLIEGLPPTISIEQKLAQSNPRSTVSTTTEIYDYLRLLYARTGTPYCYKCSRPITRQSVDQIVDAILCLPAGTRFLILAPMVRGKKGEHREILNRAARDGFIRMRVDGTLQAIRDVRNLSKLKPHDLDLAIDRLVIKEKVDEVFRSRLTESAEIALKYGEGLLIVSRKLERGKWDDRVLSEHYACPHCNVNFEELSPRLFSFNSPYGACPTCDGLGTRQELDEDLVVPDRNLTLNEGAIEAWKKGGKKLSRYYARLMKAYCDGFDVNPDIPYRNIPEAKQSILMHGTTPEDVEQYGAFFEGILPNLKTRFDKTESQAVKRRIHGYMSELPCPSCGGARLRPESLAVRVSGKSIVEITHMTVTEALAFFNDLTLSKEEETIAGPILKEIQERLKFMDKVGVAYLSLDRRSSTLSGGEMQRIRLATQVGCGLVGVCYVLDEPTVGLHVRDNARLLETLRNLQNMGNTVIIVEHDEMTIRSADHIIDMGPGAGEHGGKIVAQGILEKVLKNPRSLTASYLTRELEISIPEERRKFTERKSIEIKGAREFNLKDIDVRIPLGGIICVTGVSGSGKSTLIREILYKGLSRLIHRSHEKPGAHEKITGSNWIDKVVEIDQSPIGRTPRSNPATYAGVFNHVRNIFAMLKESKIRGYSSSRFSFNVRGGRCEACQGQGVKRIEMHFLPDVYVRCDVCKGKKYSRETLEVKYRGKSISDVLDMSVEEARHFFKNFPKLVRVLRTLESVGLGYLRLGQSSTTLSGGEAQRVKLAAELGRASTGNTLYILDEPTTGLHFSDISKLMEVLNKLADMGNTLVIIEHNLDVIKMADWVIDLGPEGGEEGGYVVFEGRPEDMIRCDTSHTGRYISKVFAHEAVTA
jgi:excinuclease ABC subunit A